MTPEKVIEWAREPGLVEPRDDASTLPADYLEALTRFAQLATEAERKSRQAAQIENEELKARIARFGMEQAIAVNKARKDERERCAKVCDTTPPEPFRPSIEAAHAIRSLKD